MSDEHYTRGITEQPTVERASLSEASLNEANDFWAQHERQRIAAIVGEVLDERTAKDGPYFLPRPDSLITYERFESVMSAAYRADRKAGSAAEDVRELQGTMHKMREDQEARRQRRLIFAQRIAWAVVFFLFGYAAATLIALGGF